MFIFIFGLYILSLGIYWWNSSAYLQKPVLKVIYWNIILYSFRPICIPCTKETNTALKLGADSTCKDQGEFTLETY